MKRIFLISMILSFGLWLGCGGDDSTGPDIPTVDTIRVAAASVAPSQDSVSDTIWDRITSKSIAVTSGQLSLSAKQRPVSALAVAGQIDIKAAVYSDTLYLRLAWADAVFDVWPQVWVVDSMVGGSPLFEHLVLRSQDQLLVLFGGLPNDGFDVWHWRAHSTAIEQMPGGMIRGFAEGRVLRNGILTTDAGNLEIVIENHKFGEFNRPTFLHPDTTDFHGFILPLAIADSLDVLPTSGWSLHDTVPGYLTDQDVGEASAAARGSRWDIRSLATYASGAYTVVLSRALSTGDDASDLSMQSGQHVPVRLAISNRTEFVFDEGSADQGITKMFYLTIP